MVLESDGKNQVLGMILNGGDDIMNWLRKLSLIDIIYLFAGVLFVLSLFRGTLVEESTAVRSFALEE